MRLLKIAFTGISVLIGLFLIISLFLPPTYHVERSVFIDKPKDEVYPHVANLHNWAA